MRKACLFALLAAFISISPSFGEIWVMATSHTHTISSDGTKTSLEVGRAAKTFMSRICAITDHVEGYRQKASLWQPSKLVGFAAWKSAFEQACTQLRGEGLELIPGGEGALNTRPDGLMGANHILMIGGATSIYEQMERIVVQSGESDLMAARLRMLADKSGAVLVAAHPKCAAYPFDKGLLKFVDAIEVFDSTADYVKELRVVVDHPEARNKPIAVTTGSDYHGDDLTRLSILGEALRVKVPQTWGADCMSRHIWLPASSGLCTAVKRARTYAALGKARIVSIAALPGGQHNTRNPLDVKVEGMNYLLGKSVHCLLVRRGDGKTAEWDLPISIQASSGNFAVDFAKLPPATLKSGSFLYLLVANQIATSGIELLPRDDIVVAKRPGLLDQIGKVASGLAEGGLTGALNALTGGPAPTTPPAQQTSSPTPAVQSPAAQTVSEVPVGPVVQAYVGSFSGDGSGLGAGPRTSMKVEVFKDLRARVRLEIMGADGRLFVWQMVLPRQYLRGGTTLVGWTWAEQNASGPVFLGSPGPLRLTRVELIAYGSRSEPGAMPGWLIPNLSFYAINGRGDRKWYQSGILNKQQ